VVCAVTCRGKLLMCRRANEPAQGEWITPSGFLEGGETLQEGAARETLEETGVIVDPVSMELLSVIDLAGIEQVAVVFRCELSKEPLIRPGPECLDAAFLAEDEIREVDVAWRDAMGDSMPRFFEQQRTGAFCIRLVNIGVRPGEHYRLREYPIATVLPDNGDGRKRAQ